MRKLLFPALFTLALHGCNTAPAETATAPDAAATEATAPDAMAEPAAPAAETTDPETYGQYLSCKINGQPYLAYYVDGHISNITNTMNMASFADFATSTDWAPLNGENKNSELHLRLFELAKKRAGTYTSPDGFHMDGHASFAKPSGSGLDYVSFIIAPGQKLTVTSLEDGIVKGSFTADVLDEKDKNHVLHLTEGYFKLALDSGVKEISKTKDGDVDMDKLMKDMMK